LKKLSEIKENYTEFFHKRMFLSSPTDIIVLPSGEKATQFIAPLCPWNL